MSPGLQPAWLTHTPKELRATRCFRPASRVCIPLHMNLSGGTCSLFLLYGLFRGRTSRTTPSTITAAPIKTWMMNPVPTISSPAITTKLVRSTIIPVMTRASPAIFLRATIRIPTRDRLSSPMSFPSSKVQILMTADLLSCVHDVVMSSTRCVRLQMLGRSVWNPARS